MRVVIWSYCHCDKKAAVLQMEMEWQQLWLLLWLLIAWHMAQGSHCHTQPLLWVKQRRTYIQCEIIVKWSSHSIWGSAMLWTNTLSRDYLWLIFCSFYCPSYCNYSNPALSHAFSCRMNSSNEPVFHCYLSFPTCIDLVWVVTHHTLEVEEKALRILVWHKTYVCFSYIDLIIIAEIVL